MRQQRGLAPSAIRYALRALRPELSGKRQAGYSAPNGASGLALSVKSHA